MQVVVGSVIAFVLVAGLLTAIGVLGFPSSASAKEQVFLEAVEDVGVSPFAPAAGPKSPVSRPNAAQPGGAPGGAVVEAVACDAGALVATLEGDGRLAGAWTEALNSDATLTWSGGNKVRPDQVRAYISELNGQVLSKDVRVTNFQYTKGSPTSVQSVLQAGSSVLVDKVGVVRVRCKCGNPLIPMKRLTAKPVYEGKPWVGFVEIIVLTRCDDNEYWNGKECRDIDCKDDQYFDGDECRTIECDDDEELRDGYCRPDRCDQDDKQRYDGRGCERVDCDGDEKNFDGHGCRPPSCDSNEQAFGNQCVRPDCEGENPPQDCDDPECPPDDPTPGPNCVQDNQQQTNSQECLPDDKDCVDQRDRQQANVTGDPGTQTDPAVDPVTGADPVVGTPEPVECPTNKDLNVGDPGCEPAVENPVVPNEPVVVPNEPVVVPNEPVVVPKDPPAGAGAGGTPSVKCPFDATLLVGDADCVPPNLPQLPPPNLPVDPGTSNNGNTNSNNGNTNSNNGNNNGNGSGADNGNGNGSDQTGGTGDAGGDGG